jgi:hypothetical protein
MYGIKIPILSPSKIVASIHHKHEEKAVIYHEDLSIKNSYKVILIMFFIKFHLSELQKIGQLVHFQEIEHAK